MPLGWNIQELNKIFITKEYFKVFKNTKNFHNSKLFFK